MGNTNKKKGCLTPVVLIGAIAIAVSFLTMKSNPRLIAKDSKTKEISQEIQLEVEDRLRRSFIADTKHKLAKQFKDPDSVEFKQTKYFNSPELGEIIYGQVNAKNSFGEYSGFERFISNGKTTFMEKKDVNFADI